ncbi:hypothetical protein KY290_026179 [Solanum tuberosum]|uniref:Uncharacterized protein n=1 Tax=Solanum tuberosum TaxID=4113 RepID=A0ABQ7UVN9_SOLTU|nr:hypothetical protein KY284_032795 [Solanum tuberosum]KAH0755909.1 hypothetical protein KY290_026179 [Solanum tuberosum]
MDSVENHLEAHYHLNVYKRLFVSRISLEKRLILFVLKKTWEYHEQFEIEMAMNGRESCIVDVGLQFATSGEFNTLFVWFKSMPPKVRSLVWEHFIVVQDNEERQKARCLTCGVIIIIQELMGQH